MRPPLAAQPRGRQSERKNGYFTRKKKIYIFLRQTNFKLLSQINTIKRRKANWIGRILHRDCLLKYGTEGKTDGKIEVTG